MQNISHTHTAQGFNVYIFEEAQLVNIYGYISKSCGQQSSVVDPWHFGKDPDPEFAPLTNGSGSCYFRYWPSKMGNKNYFVVFCFLVFSAYYFLKLHLHHFSKIKMHNEVFFLTIFAWWKKDPDPDLVLMDPEPGGPKTYGSGSATLQLPFTEKIMRRVPQKLAWRRACQLEWREWRPLPWPPPYRPAPPRNHERPAPTQYTFHVFRLALIGFVNNWPPGGWSGWIRDAVITDPDADPILNPDPDFFRHCLHKNLGKRVKHFIIFNDLL